ncbi:MAG: hypothetical protein ABW046_19790 [Actinoplanes sp.]
MIARHTVGNALVLHARAEISTEARSVALSVDSDPENDIVILDLQNELPFDIWDTVATELHHQRLRRGIRLVVCGARPETGALAGQWLSDRLGRPVIAPFGQLIPGAAGLLFVHAADLGGWVCYRRGRTPVWQSKRYPVPAWDGAAVDQLTISSTCAAEPLPGGVWLRDSRDEEAIAAHATRLSTTMPCLPNAMPVILGCPGTDPLSLDDIARFWRGLAPEGREHARFVQYGPVALPAGEQLGQVLADQLQFPVRVYTGVPAGKPQAPTMFAVSAGGEPGWQVFAQELAYRPRETLGAVAMTPRILSHHAPAELGEPIGDRAYQYAHDAVVEVIPSGLWLRGPAIPRYAERIRGVAMDPDHAELVVDDSAPALVDRYRELADDLVARLDPAAYEGTTLRLSSVVAVSGPRVSAAAGGVEEVTYRYPKDEVGARRPVPEPEPATAPAGFTVAGPAVAPPVPPVAEVAVPVPAEPTTAVPAVASPTVWTMSRPPAPTWATGPTMDLPVVGASTPGRFQRTPGDEAKGYRPDLGLDEERAWLRLAFRRELGAASAVVARVLAENPALQGGPDALEQAAAVHLYLSSSGDGVDRALRTAEPGSHVPFARCVAAGVSRLPVFRGVTYTTAEVSLADLRLIAARRLLTDWGFVNALAEPPADLPGNLEVLFWSATARRTRPLETGDGVPGRVLFLPGTTFKVLQLREPAEGTRGRLLLREVAADEPGVDGRVPFDDVALAALHQRIEQQAGAAPVSRPAANRFGRVPGLR